MAAREKNFVRYSDSVETLQAGEAETIDQITATLLNIAKKVGERQRHTVRGEQSHCFARQIRRRFLLRSGNLHSVLSGGSDEVIDLAKTSLMR
jgi:hypothetical protein